eukprot:3368399-Alexandrium_andersonii.AAC.1
MQILSLPPKAGLEGVRRCERARSHTPIRDPPIRDPCNPTLLARGSPVDSGPPAHDLGAT